MEPQTNELKEAGFDESGFKRQRDTSEVEIKENTIPGRRLESTISLVIILLHNINILYACRHI